MKAKKFQLMAVLAALLVTMNLQAQVTIGSLEAPKAGTILDLNRGATGGLLFSNVALPDPTHIPGGNVFAGIETEMTSNTDLIGMVVYNTTNENGLTPGLYVWTGTKWISLSDIAEIAQLAANLSTLDLKVGEKSSLATNNKTTIVDAINDVFDTANNLSSANEVTGSPYFSYEAFTAPSIPGVSPPETTIPAGAGNSDNIYATPVFAYVTFTSSDILNTSLITPEMKLADPRWNDVANGKTWRLDYSPNANPGEDNPGAWHLTSNMTEVITASLADQNGSMSLVPISEETANLTVTNWLQYFRNNLKALLGKFEKQDEKTFLTIANGGTGATTVAGARNALGLGDTAGALPVANGGTGATTPEAARTNLGAQQTLSASAANNLLVAPTTLGGQPTTKPIADFAPQSTTYTKTEIDNAYATKTSAVEGNVNVAATYRNISPMERHIYCRSFVNSPGSGGNFYIRLCPAANYASCQLELMGRYVYTTVPVIFRIINGSFTKIQSTIVMPRTENNYYTNCAITYVNNYVWLRVNTPDRELQNLCIKIYGPISTTDASVLVTSINPGGSWSDL